MCILTQKYTSKKYKMRVFQNKEHMISYYQLKKIEKNNRDAIKSGSKLAYSKIKRNCVF